jgi:hypothetical protein
VHTSTPSPLRRSFLYFYTNYQGKYIDLMYELRPANLGYLGASGPAWTHPNGQQIAVEIDLKNNVWSHETFAGEADTSLLDQMGRTRQADLDPEEDRRDRACRRPRDQSWPRQVDQDDGHDESIEGHRRAARTLCATGRYAGGDPAADLGGQVRGPRTPPKR